jgi:hypothetical protein
MPFILMPFIGVAGQERVVLESIIDLDWRALEQCPFPVGIRSGCHSSFAKFLATSR